MFKRMLMFINYRSIAEAINKLISFKLQVDEIKNDYLQERKDFWF